MKRWKQLFVSRMLVICYRIASKIIAAFPLKLALSFNPNFKETFSAFSELEGFLIFCRNEYVVLYKQVYYFAKIFSRMIGKKVLFILKVIF